MIILSNNILEGFQELSNLVVPAGPFGLWQTNYHEKYSFFSWRSFAGVQLFFSQIPNLDAAWWASAIGELQLCEHGCNVLYFPSLNQLSKQNTQLKILSPAISPSNEQNDAKKFQW